MKRILVADDSVTIQKVIALTFADEPFEVQSVGTGAEALELVKSWKPDIVLADVIMPQMNGYELCRAVKQQQETSSVPVLLLAGTFEAFDEEEAKSVGANDFITKPFESVELIEKVKTLIGEVPAAPPVQPVPELGDTATDVDPGTMAEVIPQAQEPPPAPAAQASEPDIWDILSESSDDPQVEAAGGSAPAPGFGPIEDTGVVDVGSFDVGIGRPESQPPPSQPETESPSEEIQMPEVVESAPMPETQPGTPDVPPVADQPQDVDEKSRVENMEKDFFGFETGAVEEIPVTDILEEAVEEVTFEMESPEPAAEVDAQEVSFVVPEPADDQPAVTGETISPDFMALEPPPTAEVVQAQDPVVDTVPELAPPPVPQVEEPSVSEPFEVPSEVPGFASEPVPSFAEAVPSLNTANEKTDPAPEISMELEPSLVPEPPLELPVDLDTELPEEFSPEQAIEPVADIQPDPVLESPVEVRSQDATNVPDDAAIRKIVEEKIEKIVWEVVPEMAEVIIREAIQKIKDGS